MKERFGRSIYQLAFATAAVLASHTLVAQSAGPVQVSTPITAEIRQAVVDSVAAQVERIYVDPDTARLIATRVRERSAGGAYDTLQDARAFATALTADLRAINHDLHLSVAPPVGAATNGNRSGPLTFLSRSNHFAIGRADVLSGNIGYLELTGFSTDAASRDVLVGALKYLETTDAVILDLRHNRGGDGNLVTFLVSHFTGADTLATTTMKTRSGTAAHYTLASVPGPRRPNVPLYVLTSRSTGSAGEACAFILQNLGRATIIGDRTAGAGHNVTFVSSGYGFQTGISFSRVSDARTGKEWEQVGVQPDVKVDPETALDTATTLARTAIAKASGQPR